MGEHDDELSTSKTEGFKVGEKKTIAEYTNLGKTNSPTVPSHRRTISDFFQTKTTNLLTDGRPPSA